MKVETCEANTGELRSASRMLRSTHSIISDVNLERPVLIHEDVYKTTVIVVILLKATIAKMPY